MRECGMLLPIASLPSKYGIGCFSKEAYEFVDQLKEGGQSFWQILPLGPTGFGDSPYQAFSAFAGNPYFIDLEQLVGEGLLTEDECEEADFGDDDRYIAYDKIYKARFKVLKKAYERWKKDHHQFLKSKLDPETIEYCFYMAVKDHFKSASWNKWDKDIRLRKPAAVEKYKKMLADEIGFYEFQQIEFNEQWSRLKAYANENGIRIIGDIPIYVAFDGADSWAHPELFQFDEAGQPEAVAGCPPDAFTADGQLWGNPLYRWDLMQETGFQWWKERLSGSFELYDCLRIDHFRGFESYYAIPYGDKTARNGAWQKGPGKAFVDSIKEAFPDIPIIAEDLGYLTPEVRELLEYSGFPGMKILQFAFDAREKSDYIPFKYPKNCVVYTGTHDNDTILGWLHSAPPASVRYAKSYLLCETVADETCVDFFVSAALSCAADWAVIPIQDWLRLGHEARINTPSTLGGNWVWRLRPGSCTKALAKEMKRKTELYERNSVIEP